MRLRFLAVDGYNLIRRIFEARQAQSAQDIASVVESSKTSLARAIERHLPTHAAVVLEHHDRTWRHLLYPQYKANRSPTPPLLVEAIPQLEAAFLELGVKSFSVDNYEADDIIATIATAVAGHDGDVVILSTDKIYLQLLSERIVVVDHFADKHFDLAYVESRYEIRHSQFVDYLALVGDRSNNIKGVPGVGHKTAAELLGRFPDLDAIMVADDDLAGLRKIRQSPDAASQSRLLVQLKTDVDLGENLRSFRLARD